MSIRSSAQRFHIAIVAVLFGFMPLFAADIFPAPEKCDCKNVKISVIKPLATSNVAVANFNFTNQSITITAGDTVTWTVSTGTHTVTDDGGAYDSGNLVQGSTFSHTFATVGTFPYHCQYHQGSGMIGTVIVQAATQTQAPVITSATTATASIGTAFSYTLTATGSPAPSLSFTNVPGELQTNGTTISGTFSTAQVATVGIHATNSAGTVDSTLTITVQAGAIAPIITSATTATAGVGMAFSYTLTATGSPAPALSFTNVPGELQTTGATISGTFSTAQVATVGIHATNSAGTVDSTLTITVQTGAIAPSITSALTANAVAGANFNYVIAATGTAPITFSASGLPTTLALTDATISGRFAAAGQATIGLIATNSTGADNKNLVVTVAASTEGISGTWTGTFNGKKFDQTSGAKASVPDKSAISIVFTQVGSDLFATPTVNGSAGVLLTGRIGMSNFWLAGKNSAGQIETLSGHVAKNGKTISGSVLVFNTGSDEELKLSLKKQ